MDPIVYYFTDGQAQHGPYTAETLPSVIAGIGGLQPHWLAWHTGMNAWQRVDQISELLPYVNPAAWAPAIIHHEDAPSASLPQNWPGFRAKDITALSGLYYVLLGLSIVAMLLIFFLQEEQSDLAYRLYQPELSTTEANAIHDSMDQNRLYISIVTFVLPVALITAMIFWFIVLYRLWVLIQPQHPDKIPTPGVAVGYCFIPFYNFYWIFVGIAGVAKAAAQYGDRHGILGPRMSQALGIAYCITTLLSIIPIIGFVAAPIGVVLQIIFMVQMTQSIGPLLSFHGKSE